MGWDGRKRWTPGHACNLKDLPTARHPMTANFGEDREEEESFNTVNHACSCAFFALTLGVRSHLS